MDVYKHFLFSVIKRTQYSETYIQINESIVPKLKYYIKVLVNTKFNEGSYHTFYGDIKSIIISFNLLWTLVMDEAIKTADRIMNSTTKEELLYLTEKTINAGYTLITKVGKEFLPIHTQLEKQYYEEMQDKFKNYIVNLHKLMDQINGLDKQEQAQQFAKQHFPLALKYKHKILDCSVHTIAEYLAKNRNKILISIEENLKRVSNNKRSAETEHTAAIKCVRDKLYDKNKEMQAILRTERPCPVQIAEVREFYYYKNKQLDEWFLCMAQKTLDTLRNELTNTKNLAIPHNLKEEHHLWVNQLQEFKIIKNTLDNLDIVENKLLERQKLHQSMRDTSSISRRCWENMSKRIEQKFEELNILKLHASKAIVTFFSVKGANRIFYSDNIGTYFVDECGHQVYFFDYGLNLFHMNCDGYFFTTPEEDKRYYDKYGRYIMRDNQKLYQIAPCSSTYKIENGVFVKNTTDPKYPDQRNLCKMEIKDPNDKVILPQVDPIDIKGTLGIETTQYLWTNLGAVLSEALVDVAELQPKNPIHCLAHKLLYHKYKNSIQENERNDREAEKYKEKILQQRKDVAAKACVMWKKKQVKRRKPEESDDSENKHTHNLITAQQLMRTLFEQ